MRCCTPSRFFLHQCQWLMQARENLVRGDEAGTARARQLIEETIALDPHYAQACMYMGGTHI